MKARLANSMTCGLDTPVAKVKSNCSRVFTAGRVASFCRVWRVRSVRAAISACSACSRNWP